MSFMGRIREVPRGIGKRITYADKEIGKGIEKVGKKVFKKSKELPKRLSYGKKPKYGKGLRVNTRSVQNVNRGMWGL